MKHITLVLLFIAVSSHANGLTDSEELAELEAENTPIINIVIQTDSHLLEVDESNPWVE